MTEKPIIGRLVGTRATTLILATVVSLLLWRYYFPPDTIHPARRSERRSIPVAFSQQQRAAEIRHEVRELLEKTQQVWAARFPNDPMGEFNPPASTADLAKLERIVGPLPLDFLAYLEWANGQRDRQGQFYSSATLMTAEDIYTQSIELHSLCTQFMQIPLTDEGLWFHPGCLLFSDLDGGGLAINASSGKIYEWDHDGGQLTLIADSFTALLQRMLRHLETADRYEGPVTRRSKLEKQELGE